MSDEAPRYAPAAVAAGTSKADAQGLARELRESIDAWVAVIRRQAWLTCTVGLLLLSVGICVLAVLPRKYESVATFLIRNARQELLVDPNERSSAIHSDAVSEETMNSEAELVRSPAVLTSVARSRFAVDRRSDRDSDERVIESEARRLAASIRVEPLRRTNLLRVSYAHEDAAVSNAVVAQVASAYLDAHIKVHSTPGAYDVFRAASAEAKTELRSAEDKLAAMARIAGLVAPDAQKASLLQRKFATQSQYDAVLAEIEMQRARERAAREQKRATVDRIETTRRETQSMGAVDALTSLQIELKNRRTELLTKFRPDDRLVQEVDAKLADTTHALGEARGLSVTENATDVNPTSQMLQTEALSAAVSMAALEGKASQLRLQLREQDEAIARLVEASPEFESVSRQVAAAEARYDLYVKREEEARLAAVLDRQNVSNVILAQAPTVANVPVSPNLRLGVLVVLLFALIGAALAALAAEYFGVWFRVNLRQPARAGWARIYS